MSLRSLVGGVLPDKLVALYREERGNIKRRKEMQLVKNLPADQYENYISEWYKKRTGYSMNFENPHTFTQKQQWMKLYDLTARKTLLTDKYAVRKIIADSIGAGYLIPLIMIDGVDHFYSAKEIDFSKLPNQFVLKCNHGSGYNIIVKDKNSLSGGQVRKIKKKLNMWLHENFAYRNGLELVYRDIKPCIIIEKYMAINDDLPDYKFLCFSGKAKYVWCDQGRYTEHRRTVYDLEYSIQPFNFHTYEKCLNNEKPQNFNKMIQLAETLCEGFSYVRVDFYNVEGKIYFGELTFSSASGGELPNPVEYDEVLGEFITIDPERRKKNGEYRKK